MRYLIIEVCYDQGEGQPLRSTPKECHKASKPRFVEAESMDRAREIALDQGEGYYPYSGEFEWEVIRRDLRGHELVIYEIDDGRIAGLQAYLAECVDRMRRKREELAQAAERAVLASLKAKYEAGP